MKLVTVCILFFLHYTVWSTPELKISPSIRHDLGKFPSSVTQIIKFNLSNIGNDPLIIRSVRKNCSCMTTELKSKIINHNDKTSLIVTVPAFSVEGKFSKKIYIHTNSPDKSLITLTIIGNSQAVAHIKPYSSLYLGKIFSDQTFTKNFEIEHKIKNLKLGKISYTGGFKLDIITLYSNKTGTTSLKVKGRSLKHNKKISGVIIIPIKFPPNSEALTINLAANIKLSVQKSCPYLKIPIRKDLYHDALGKRIYTCCVPCLDKVKKNPQEAINALAALGEEAINIPKK